jgi:hypothetical protein
MKGNGARLLEQARQRSFYPLIDPPTITPDGESPQNIEFTGTQEVTLAAPKGIIYYTTDGSDPRAAGTGDVSATAIQYNVPVVITTTGTLKTRLLVDGVWSALNVANYIKHDEAAHVVISEIMYEPYLDENMEFLELKNVGNTAADLSGAYFFGIDFRFGDNVFLKPGQRVVLIKSLRNFRQRYPNVEIAGQYLGKLSDKGETLILYHPNGEVWFEVTYHNNNGWPLSAKGAGDSIELIDPNGDVNSPHNWRASPTLYGTPGTDEPSQ